MITRLAILLLCAGLLPACNSPSQITLADGTVITHGGHLGGKRSIAYKRTAAGTVTYVEKTDNSESFQAGVTGGVSTFGLHEVGLSSRATTASDTAIAVGAQKAATAQAAQKAAVEKAAIAADVTKTITVPK